MFWAVLTVSLHAAPDVPTSAMALTRFRLVQVNPELGGYAEDRLAQRLSSRGFRVSTPADLETVLGLERQRQLLGCTDDTSCLAEISAAFGVPLVATGRLTRLGKRLELDVRVIRQKDGQVAASDTRGTDDESRLGELLEQAANSLADQLLPRPAAKPIPWRLWGPLGGGVVALAAGGLLLVTAELEYTSWTTAGTSVGELRDGAISQRFTSLSTQRGVGFGVAGVGAALIVTGILWNALTPDPPVAVSLAPSPGGATFLVGGRF